MKRLVNMSDKPEFDPNKPFKIIDNEKPEFDPSKPFDIPKVEATSNSQSPLDQRVDREFEEYLKRAQEKGANPAEHPTMAAIGGLVNKAIPKSLEEAAILSGENTALGLGRYVTRPINAAISSQITGQPFSQSWDAEKQRAVNIAEQRPEANVGMA